MEFLEFLKTLSTILLGAAASGIPLWFKVRSLNQKIKSGDQEIESGDIKIQQQRTKAVQQDKINSEAEWKRIIEFRDAELVRLRERDDQQERQITTLWEKHVACERNEAAQGEKIIAQDEKIKASEERIKSLENRLDEMLKNMILKQTTG